LLEIYMSAYTDMVGEVRLSATKILSQLLEAVGSDYVLQNIMPRLAQIFDKSIIYQERVNVLHAVKELANDKASSELLSTMLSLAIRGTRDKIPNVRFVASMTLEQLCKFAEASVVAAQVRYVRLRVTEAGASPLTLTSSSLFPQAVPDGARQRLGRGRQVLLECRSGRRPGLKRVYEPVGFVRLDLICFGQPPARRRPDFSRNIGRAASLRRQAQPAAFVEVPLGCESSTLCIICCL